MNGAADACARCKRAAHGGPCGAPIPLPPIPVRQGTARALANVREPARLAPDVRSAHRLALVDGIADTRARAYRLSPEEREAWRLTYLRAVTEGDAVRARFLCLELDPAPVDHPRKRGA